MKPSVATKDLCHSFGQVRALQKVNIAVKEGELFGIIGPDGAGKTTLFRILTTLIVPLSGQARVMDLDTVNGYREIRNSIGYVPGRFSLYQDLTVKENLEFFATIFGSTVEENYYLIEDIYRHLEPFANRLAGDLSGGMKQKLALSCALIHKPRVLFLDEPTTGVDPVSRKEFWQMLARLKDDGITIVVSTPYMDEAIKCDRIALMQEGKVLMVDTPSAIASSFRGLLVGMKSSRTYELLMKLRDRPEVASAFAFGDMLHVNFADERSAWGELVEQLRHEGFTDLTAEPVEPGVENVFMQLLNSNDG